MDILGIEYAHKGLDILSKVADSIEVKVCHEKLGSAEISVKSKGINDALVLGVMATVYKEAIMPRYEMRMREQEYEG